MILSQDLYVTYKWRQEPVLKGVSGSFKTKCLILGPNGSGKTTFFRAICALTNITSGKILIDERSIEDFHAAKGVLSANFQEVYTLLGSNVFDLVKLYTNLSDGDSKFAFGIIKDFGIDLAFPQEEKAKRALLRTNKNRLHCTCISNESQACSA